jgi:hypothetical protein
LKESEQKRRICSDLTGEAQASFPGAGHLTPDLQRQNENTPIHRQNSRFTEYFPKIMRA